MEPKPGMGCLSFSVAAECRRRASGNGRHRGAHVLDGTKLVTQLALIRVYKSGHSFGACEADPTLASAATVMLRDTSR